MAAIFSPRADLFMRTGLIGAGSACAVLLVMIVGGPMTDYGSARGFTPPQPVPFSHQHHAGQLGIDCRYCHSSVEVAPNAGMPPTETCMTCHSQLWTNAEMLAPVRQSLAENRPLRWNRVYTLPDYVYFDHSIHVAKGVGCTECHGPIADMPLTRKASDLHMAWCLSCHRDPAPHLRPREDVFDPHWQPRSPASSGEALMGPYHIHTANLADCTVCHR
jgi:Cytochrome c7 and related cytochrome c